jgi:prolipoprotein diacylglyceryl transferase
MPVAYLPSPASALWHLGTIPVRAYALCMVAGVLVGLWLTDRRYRKAGYQPGVILDMATIAVPVGLIGARIYSVLTNLHRYVGPGRDWTDALRVWDGGMGVAGAVAAGALAAWVYCRRTGIDGSAVALAAAPALAVAQAISVWGNWFSQELYGQPSGLPWAVDIAPQHRVAGYQPFATFQPLFLYESLFDVLIAVALAVAIRKFMLSGGQAFALYAALWATAGATIEALRIDYSARMFGLRLNMLAMVVVLVAAGSYLASVQHRRRQRMPVRPAEPTVAQPTLHPRSSRATSGQIGLAGASEQADGTPDSVPGTQLRP